MSNTIKVSALTNHFTEPILRNRILYDTRNLRGCYRKFLVQTLEDASIDLSPYYEQFLINLRSLETTLEKHQLTHQMNLRETTIYKSECSRIEQEILEAKQNIDVLKVALEQAQARRKNKLEYDNVAKQINKHASREESRKRSAQLREEIQALMVERAALEAREELRGKQLYTVVQAAHELQDTISDERRASEAAAAAANEVVLPPTPDVQVEEEEEGAVAEDGDKDVMDMS
ncbi:THO complex subunit 7 [Rhizophlyctis rosea]|nr:THO complex subunit 7 [Rhizophlyctis rosea]